MRTGLLLIVAAVPLGLFLAAQVYVSRFEGWGQWAAAPVLLLPMPVSAVITAICGWRWRREAGEGGVRPSTIMATVLAAGPLLWLAYRFIVAG